ncbi:hypothetical protein SPI_04853 [Niveomyces insectorum RCEF 264]|uniref:Uncharacterized protein n=1 Tax=Niveomyces insectorum RCEF 264 TaxID=1081102 RepID=A0A167UX38_9HYPO|nr:hypothetical protein SPI_04853 [Niveomyces insectorum RCEF 264]
MTDIDVNISNGSCYQYYESPLDPRFLPCGNALAGIQTCCYAGDACLEDAACAGVRDGINVTYVAGCTSESFFDLRGDRCPPKPAIDAWSPIVFCDDGTDQWAACTVSDHPSTVVATAPCSCQHPGTVPLSSTARFVAVNGGPDLQTTGILPTTAGGAMTWAAGFTPTIASTATSATTSKTPEFTVPMPTFYPTSSSDKEGGHVDHQALVIGVSIGGVLAIIGLSLFAYCMANARRQRNGGGGRGGVPGLPRRGLRWPQREVPDDNEDAVPLPKYTRDLSPPPDGGSSSHAPDEQPPAYDAVVSPPEPVVRH